ncbi:MAG: DUF2141 domain-containing protein [Bacteroidota bacterium]
MKWVFLCCMLMAFTGMDPAAGILGDKDSLKLEEKGAVQITFTGIKSDKGVIAAGVFLDQPSFEEETPMKSVRFSKNGLKEGVLKTSIELMPGTYGISVLDDENTNKEMDYNFIGLPKEGFGFSNYYLSGFSKPHFDKFKFDVLLGKTVSITIRMRYI